MVVPFGSVGTYGRLRCGTTLTDRGRNSPATTALRCLQRRAKVGQGERENVLAVLLKDLLITFGIVLGAYLLSRLVGGVAGGLWLVQSLLWYIAVGALLRFAWQVLEWWVEVIIVTDKRFMVTSGII